MSRQADRQGAASRIEIALACGLCETRNYKTTRKPDQSGRIEKKKFCPICLSHTLHKETK
jgi:large subunit ribosomal protein L33